MFTLAMEQTFEDPNDQRVVVVVVREEKGLEIPAGIRGHPADLEGIHYRNDQQSVFPRDPCESVVWPVFPT